MWFGQVHRVSFIHRAGDHGEDFRKWGGPDICEVEDEDDGVIAVASTSNTGRESENGGECCLLSLVVMPVECTKERGERRKSL